MVTKIRKHRRFQNVRIPNKNKRKGNVSKQISRATKITTKSSTIKRPRITTSKKQANPTRVFSIKLEFIRLINYRLAKYKQFPYFKNQRIRTLN